MSASSSHSPLHKPEQDSAWVPPLDMALGLARQALAEQADANVYDKQAMITAAVQLEIRLRGLVAALDKGDKLAAQVAEHGPFPMPMGEPQPVELTEEQAEALINAGNGALSDYYHERQCHCSNYPAGCVTNSGYRRAAGFWDTDAFAIGLPAVLGVWESLRRPRRFTPLEEAVQGIETAIAPLTGDAKAGADMVLAYLRTLTTPVPTVRVSPWDRAVAGLNALVDANIAFWIEPDGHISGPFGDEHIEWDHDTSRWRLVHDDEDDVHPRHPSPCRVPDSPDCTCPVPAPRDLTPGADAARRMIADRQTAEDPFPGACEACGDTDAQWCPDCAACRKGCHGGHDNNDCTHPNAPWSVAS